MLLQELPSLRFSGPSAGSLSHDSTSIRRSQSYWGVRDVDFLRVTSRMNSDRAWFFSRYEASNRGQWACALRAPPNHAPGVLIPQVRACTNLNTHVPTAFNLAPLDRALAAVYVRCSPQGAHSALPMAEGKRDSILCSNKCS